MGCCGSSRSCAATGGPFDLSDDRAYRHWRASKLASRPQGLEALVVDVADPRALRASERQALLERVAQANMALYRSPVTAEDKALPRRLGAQLGLLRLDANWLADDDGISSIAVSDRSDGGDGPGERAGFIPYTNRPIRWHTDGYYHPAARRIRSMILHCVRPAAEGGVNALMDHEMAYIALRDESPALVAALMQPDAMTIPARLDDQGVARPAQTGPVFSVDATDGTLHMRYTARTRSIEWKDDATTRAAAACLSALLEADGDTVFRVRMAPGMGLVAHNVLHDRSGFTDDASQPRLLYRARYLDRCAAPEPQ